MQAAVVSVFLVSASLAQYGPPQRYYGHGPARKDEIEQQQKAFKHWWGDELAMKLSDLPKEGRGPDFRVPYSGHDYPDLSGGTLNAMFKYDQAFHRYQPLATQYERGDVSACAPIPTAVACPPGTATATAGRQPPFATPSRKGVSSATA